MVIFGHLLIRARTAWCPSQKGGVKVCRTASRQMEIHPLKFKEKNRTAPVHVLCDSGVERKVGDVLPLQLEKTG